MGWYFRSVGRLFRVQKRVADGHAVAEIVFRIFLKSRSSAKKALPEPSRDSCRCRSTCRVCSRKDGSLGGPPIGLGTIAVPVRTVKPEPTIDVPALGKCPSLFYSFYWRVHMNQWDLFEGGPAGTINCAASLPMWPCMVVSMEASESARTQLPASAAVCFGEVFGLPCLARW